MMIYLIAIFLGVVTWEIYYSRKNNLKVYEFRETASHIATGIGQQAINIMIFPALILVYDLVQKNMGFIQFDLQNKLLWVLVALLSDLCFYFAHRVAHRSNFFVGAHAVHHQANDFNHASAFRQSWLNRPVMFLFYVPLAILGIPVIMVTTTLVANLFIQFFSHNGVVKRHLGILEYIFVTPRSHFVHHGHNDDYLDKNYGGVLIIWDRLFGTYQDLKEEVPVQIGSMDPVDHLDPVSANFDYFKRILYVAKNTDGFFGKLKVWFGTPEMLGTELTRLGYQGSANPPKTKLNTKLVLAYIAVLIAAVGTFIKNSPNLSLQANMLLTFVILFGSWGLGQLISPKAKEKTA